MTDVLSAEDIKKAVGAFSGECFFFFLPPIILPSFVSSAKDSSAFISTQGRLEDPARQNIK